MREIMSMAMLLENVSNDLTVFVEWAGHVKNLTVRIYFNYDDKKNKKTILNESFYDDLGHGTEKRYIASRDILKELLREYIQI